MDVCSAKWCLLGFLLVIGGLAKASADAADKSSSQPTVNECRVHVEAALKQYWSHSPEELSKKNPPVEADEEETTIIGDQEKLDQEDESEDEQEGRPSPKYQSDDEDDEDKLEHSKGSDVEDEPEEPKNQLEGEESEEDDNRNPEADEEEDDNRNPEADEEEDDNRNPEADDEEDDNRNPEADEEEDDNRNPQAYKEEEDDNRNPEVDDDDDDKTQQAETDDKSQEVEKDDIGTDTDGEDDEGGDKHALDSTHDGEASTEESPEDGGGARVEQELPAEEPSTKESQSQTQVEEVESEDEKDERKGDQSDEEMEQKKVTETKEAVKEDDEEKTKEVEKTAGNIEEEETDIDDDDEIPSKVLFIRNRQHIDDILGLDDIGTENDKDETYLVQSTLKDLKKTYDTAIKPMEALYKFRDMSTRVLGDAELFGNPMILLIGPWSAGKSSIINYLLGIERTPSALKTGPEPTDTQFTVVTYGEKAELISGTEMAVDWPFSTVQKFGQAFLDHFRGVRLPHRLLKKVTFVDTPGIMETRKHQDKGYPFNEAFQWFIDRADAIYITFDPTKLEIGSELEAILDQLKGREAQIRFILNKADTIRRSDVMKFTGQLFWNLSPLLGSSEAPVIYTVSLMTKPFHPGSPARFLLEQEKAFLHDIRVTMDKRVENRIAYARRHAVRVRNHAKMVDCYLATYYRHKSIFSNRKVVAESITENPNQYSIYAGLSALTNVSRYDLPDPDVYKVFFRLNPLYDFKPLSATCSYFKGCPLDKLDISIAYDLPELLGKYKKRTKVQMSEWDEEKGR